MRRLTRITMRSSSILALSLVMANLQGQASDRTPLTGVCAKEVSEAAGLPFLFSMRGGLQYGLSTRPSNLSSRGPLAIWVYNPTYREQLFATCGDLEVFFLDSFDLMDGNGERVPTKAEASGGQRIEAANMGCARNITITIAPHSCMHGDLDHPTYDFVKYLGDQYALEAGHYQVVPRLVKNNKRAVTGLTVDILP